MKFFLLTTGLIAALDQCVVAFTPPHPCQAFPTKVSKLATCSTAKSFCSSYIGGTASFTRTSTVTQTVAQSSQTSFSTETDTVTSYTNTVTETDTETDTATTTITTTTTQANCGEQTPLPSGTPFKLARRAAPKATPSCGIASNANPSEVSGACNCILASSTTTTAIVTSGGLGTTTIMGTTTFVITKSADTTTTETTTTTVTSTSTSTACATPTAAPANAFCGDGTAVNGLSAQCQTEPCSTTNLRIEALSETVYEGVIYSGPQYVTTVSGGTHLCDGTNGGANPAPALTGTTILASAGSLCGFGFDGTYSSQFQDFFIETIGPTSQTNDEFWGILQNLVFTPSGGCQTEPRTTDELLWAFNAFNVNNFLRVQPVGTPVLLAPGQSTTFTVQGTDGSGSGLSNIAGADFDGQTSDSNGNVQFTAPTTPGTYRYKATRSDSIRSNAVTVIVQG